MFTVHFSISVFQYNPWIYCVLKYPFHTLLYSVPVWFTWCFRATHSYIGFYTVHFPFYVFQCNSLTSCVLQCAFHTMFYSVPVWFSRFFSATHPYIFFSTLCISHFLFSVQLNKHTLFYNMHFTLCSRVCRSDFLGVSV